MLHINIYHPGTSILLLMVKSEDHKELYLNQ
jgi:hypothetical protein